MNGYFFSSNISVNASNDNAIPPLFCPGAVPYEDRISEGEIIYEREVEDNTDDNEHAIGELLVYHQEVDEAKIK